MRETRMYVVHSIKSLQDTFEARASEWFLTGAIVTLGIVFVLNDTMFFKPTFEGLRSIMGSQAAWASLLLSVGLLRLTVLCINGSYYRTPHFRAVTAFLSSGVWFLFCLGFVRNGSVLIAVMPWIFLMDTYNAKRAGREAGTSEYIQRYSTRKREQVNAGTPQVANS